MSRRELLLRWAELPAEGAAPATRAATDGVVRILPKLSIAPFVDVSAELEVPGVGPPRRSYKQAVDRHGCSNRVINNHRHGVDPDAA
jgi:hypothetical protein